MQKKNDSNLILISILTAITIIVWISIESAQRLLKKDLNIVPSEILSPLDPTLDKVVFDEIKSRKSLTPQELAGLKPKHVDDNVPTQSQTTQPDNNNPNSEFPQEPAQYELTATDSAMPR